MLKSFCFELLFVFLTDQTRMLVLADCSVAHEFNHARDSCFCSSVAIDVFKGHGLIFVPLEHRSFLFKDFDLIFLQDLWFNFFCQC